MRDNGICRYFALVREKDPFRLEMMEYYSTALWHLQVFTTIKHLLGSIFPQMISTARKVVTMMHFQEEVQLSALAQDLQRLDKFSAAAWYFNQMQCQRVVN